MIVSLITALLRQGIDKVFEGQVHFPRSFSKWHVAVLDHSIRAVDIHVARLIVDGVEDRIVAVPQLVHLDDLLELALGKHDDFSCVSASAHHRALPVIAHQQRSVLRCFLCLEISTRRLLKRRGSSEREGSVLLLASHLLVIGSRVVMAVAKTTRAAPFGVWGYSSAGNQSNTFSA